MTVDDVPAAELATARDVRETYAILVTR